MSPGRAREGPFASPPAQPGTVRGPALLTVPGPGRGRRRPAAWWWEQDVWSENEGWSALLPSLLLSAGAGGCGRRARGVRVRVRVYARACGETGRAAGPGVRVGAWCRGPHASKLGAVRFSLSNDHPQLSRGLVFFLFRGSVCCLGVCVWAAPALLSESPQPPRAVSYTVQPHTPSMHAHAPPAPRVRPAALHSIGRRAARPVLRPPSAAPPTADDAPSASPLTEAGLTAYLASGCKPKEAWR